MNIMTRGIKNSIMAAIIVLTPAQMAQADAIDSFFRHCVNNAPDVSAIANSAANAGFQITEIGANARLGLRRSSDETIQVNVATQHRFECAVTTSDMPNPAQVTETFFTRLGLSPRRGRAQGTIGGQSYTFMHDTNGGEAFVMYID
jgi:hypothetical protein